MNASSEQWVVWCHLNDESELLAKQIDGSIEVRGSDSSDYKEAAVLWFTGEICDCEFVNRAKTPKLNTWIQQRKLQLTSKNIIEKTETGGSLNQKNITPATKKKETNITENTINKININGKKEPENNKINITKQEELSTQQTLNTDKSI